MQEQEGVVDGRELEPSFTCEACGGSITVDALMRAGDRLQCPTCLVIAEVPEGVTEEIEGIDLDEFFLSGLRPKPGASLRPMRERVILVVSIGGLGGVVWGLVARGGVLHAILAFGIATVVAWMTVGTGIPRNFGMRLSATVTTLSITLGTVWARVSLGPEFRLSGLGLAFLFSVTLLASVSSAVLVHRGTADPPDGGSI